VVVACPLVAAKGLAAFVPHLLAQTLVAAAAVVAAVVPAVAAAAAAAAVPAAAAAAPVVPAAAAAPVVPAAAAAVVPAAAPVAPAAAAAAAQGERVPPVPCSTHAGAAPPLGRASPVFNEAFSTHGTFHGRFMCSICSSSWHNPNIIIPPRAVHYLHTHAHVTCTRTRT